MEHTVSLNPYTIQVIGWILVFLISSLIAIIVWLAKTVIKKVDDIAEKQDRATLERSSMKVTLDQVCVEVTDIYKKLEDIPKLALNVSLTQEMVNAIKLDINIIKIEHSDFTKRLSIIERQSAVNAEWIRMTENNNKK